jgi:hypothetical protein
MAVALEPPTRKEVAGECVQNAFPLKSPFFLEAVNFELVAREVVAMLVGSIGLIAAVPLTTALASFLSLRLPLDVLPEAEADHAGHAH